MMQLPEGIYSAEEEIGKFDRETINAPALFEDNSADDGERITPLRWMLYMLGYSIPVVSLIMLVAMIAGSESKTKRNWAQGALVLHAVTVIVIILILVFISSFSKSSVYSLFLGS